MKNKGKSLSAKDIVGSPYFIAALLVIIVIAIMALLVYFVMGVMDTKKELVLVRESYQNNMNQIAQLEELRAQSEQAEAQLKVFDTILPKKLGDVYVLEEDIEKECEAYGLDVTAAEEPMQKTGATVETSFIFTVSGKYDDFISYFHYIEALTQIRRFDAITLSVNDDGSYSAVLAMTVLSQEGAEGVVVVTDETATAA